MTALEMAGVSLTLMLVDEELVGLIGEWVWGDRRVPSSWDSQDMPVTSCHSRRPHHGCGLAQLDRGASDKPETGDTSTDGGTRDRAA